MVKFVDLGGIMRCWQIFHKLPCVLSQVRLSKVLGKIATSLGSKNCIRDQFGCIILVIEIKTNLLILEVL